MRTTLTLEDDVAETARSMARASGRTLGEVISELARRGLKARAPRAKRGALPTFELREHDEVIPSDRAARLLSED